nr:F-box/FBD/LRR-repeat protein At1g13570-like [Ipomoea batatas]
MYVINKVLLQHNGSIRKFVLHLDVNLIISVEFVLTNLQDALNLPSLETLSFLMCRNMCNFNITAPKLCILTIVSDVHDKFLPINLDLRSICTLDFESPHQMSKHEEALWEHFSYL